MIGSKVGQYTITKKLGEGGMGAVYVGEHDVLRKKAAIKVLLPQWTQNAMIVGRFTNEAIAMGALEHPNIVGVADAGQLADGSWFIVMEYLDGATLGRFAESQGGPLSPHLTLQILAQVAAGLEAAHKRGIVHRDLKPDNIFLVAKKGNQHFVKVLDWGISKLGELDGGSTTKTGMIAGTPAYMAPEQMRDLRTVDRRSDVYALGVIAYQMVTGGWLPFQRQDRPEEFAQLSMPAIHHIQMTETPIDPRHRAPSVTAGWANAILAALHPDPARRPQTAKAFILLLAGATPGDQYQATGTDIVKAYAEELLEIGNLEETVRAVKPSGSPSRAPSRYRLGDQLGAGGMAEVFRATQTGAEGFSRTVAVKRVLPGYSTMPQFSSMFVQEAQIASHLDHPNIVSILDFDRDEDGQLFLAMEFVEGRDLAAVAASGKLPLGTIIFIVSEALRGLGYAHELPTAGGPRGVIHRDVSPHNILLSWEGAVKVSDFGIAKAREATAATASTLIKGKPQYMSPEQANGEALDGRSDLFAVGIILWELLTGRRLFEGATQEALAQVFFGHIERPSRLRSDVPADLEAVTMRLLARERAGRYAKAELAIEDLARCGDAPRNGRSELVRLLAERFPDAIAARASRQPDTSARAGVSGQPPGTGATRRDGAPQPTPIAGWPPHTTLGSAAGQSVVGPTRKSRAPLFVALGIGVAAISGVGAYLAARDRGGHKQPASATAPSDTTTTVEPNPSRVEARPVEASLTITTDPSGANVLVDGTARGRSPLTLSLKRDVQVLLEVARDGFEPAQQRITLDRDSQSVLLTLRAIPVAVQDAGTTAAAPPQDAHPPGLDAKPPKKVIKPPRGPKQTGSGSFNPDDAVD